MGLFDRILGKGAAKPKPARDAREPAPRDVLEWRQHACVPVHGVNYFQPAIMGMGEGDHDVVVRKPNGRGEWGDWAVRTTGGVTLGILYEKDLEGAGVPTRGAARATVCAPRYLNEEYWSVYLHRGQ